MLTIATHNPNKFAEIKAILSPIACQSTEGLQVTPPEETGLSFIENALIKARALSAKINMPVIADDSGLVVPSLEGAPGIYSARYAGPTASDHDNIIHLLNQFDTHPQRDRQAFFICVMVYLSHANDPCPIIAEGRLYGEISLDIKGEFGFGYDPVFFLPSYQKTLAELSPDIKNQISHRFHALQSLKQQLIHDDTYSSTNPS